MRIGLENSKNNNKEEEPRMSLLDQKSGVVQRITEEYPKGIINNNFDNIVDPNRKKTAIDIPALGPNSTKEDFFHWVAKETGVDFFLLSRKSEEIENSEEEKKIEDIYKKLNAAYQQAKVFLKDVLKYKEEQIKTEPSVLKNEKDLIKLFENTRMFKGKTDTLSQSIKYCRMLKTALATYEATKHDARLLEKITRLVEELLISNDTENPDKKPLVFLGSHDYPNTKAMFSDKDGSSFECMVSLRSKEFNGVVLRLLTRPESNAENALKDGIGIRITVNKKEALILIPILYKWLIEKMNIGIADIENKFYFEENEEKELEKVLKDVTDEINKKRKDLSEDSSEQEGGFVLSEEKHNSASAGDFKTLVIKGNLQFSEDETLNSKSISSHARQFEIQLVPQDDKNEEGENNHYIYDVKKYIIAITRLDGWCSKEAFDEFIRDAAIKSGLESEKIRYFLVDKHKAPIVEIIKEGKDNKKQKAVYVAFSVYERWKKASLISEDSFKIVEAARK